MVKGSLHKQLFSGIHQAIVLIERPARLHQASVHATRRTYFALRINGAADAARIAPYRNAALALSSSARGCVSGTLSLLT